MDIGRAGQVGTAPEALAEDEAPVGGLTIPDWVYPVVTLACLLLGWQLAVVVLHIPERLIPGPIAVVEEIVSQSRLLFVHGRVTLFEALAGFALALVTGVPLAVLIASSEFAERRIFPLLAASDTVPKVAIAPLLVIFFGFGILPRILVALLITFFPIVISTVVGLKSTRPEVMYLARSMGANWFQTMWYLRFPQALPSIFGGLKISATLSVSGAMVGEFVAPREGLGYLLVTSALQFDGRLMFAAIVTLVLLGVGLFLATDRLERRALPWHISTRDEFTGGTL